MTDLNFTFDNALNCDVAMHNGYRIKAVRDESPSNPFEEWDCNWPMLVLYDGEIRGGSRNGRPQNTCYECPGDVPGRPISSVLWRFTDEQLMHWQVHVAKLLDTTIAEVTEDWADPTGYVSDIELGGIGDLRNALNDVYGEMRPSDRLEACAAMHRLLDIPAYVGVTRGYCQGDEATVLVVALPEYQAKFGCIQPITDDDLKAQVDLYGAWAWGDVYGYVIEKPLEIDEDGDVLEWEETDSCWGYYGSDHDASGLAEAALDAVPAEAPTPEVLEDAREHYSTGADDGSGEARGGRPELHLPHAAARRPERAVRQAHPLVRATVPRPLPAPAGSRERFRGDEDCPPAAREHTARLPLLRVACH